MNKGTLVIDEIIFHITDICLADGFIRFEATTTLARDMSFCREPDLTIFDPDGNLIVTLQRNPDGEMVHVKAGPVVWQQNTRATNLIGTWGK